MKRNYLLGRYYLEVEIEDVAGFDEMLSDKLHKQPTENLQIFEEAAKEVADEITAPRPENEEVIHDIQILLQSNAYPTNIRDLKVKFQHKKYFSWKLSRFLLFLFSLNLYLVWLKLLVLL